MPRIFMNGQAAAYSSRCRIRGSGTVAPPKLICKRRSSRSEPIACAASVEGICGAADRSQTPIARFARNHNLLTALGRLRQRYFAAS